MLHLHEIVPAHEPSGAPTGSVTLTLDDRRRSRLLVFLDDGREAAVQLPRGSALRDGDRLRAVEGGQIVLVSAAAENLSVARTNDAHLLLRGAYHLGNRHVPVELGDGWLAYEHDHVLDDMVRGLGLRVETRLQPFEPEGGAFQHDGAAQHDGAGHAHPHEGHSHRHA
jgi:urease accessory protein